MIPPHTHESDVMSNKPNETLLISTRTEALAIRNKQAQANFQSAIEAKTIGRRHTFDVQQKTVRRWRPNAQRIQKLPTSM